MWPSCAVLPLKMCCFRIRRPKSLLWLSVQESYFHFATSSYAASFRALPQIDKSELRNAAIDYLQSFDPKAWYDDPIVTLLKGQKLGKASAVPTYNAIGEVNGSQILATRDECDMIKDHIRSYQSTARDLREPVRVIEEKLLIDHAGTLIGNQCFDYMKQDGVTEMEEALIINIVERRLNDDLLIEEYNGRVHINRQPIYVSCVSNFTNFLDLSRKTLRSLEVGIPCIILGRSNTSQHSYRWANLLLDLCHQQSLDSGMITFLSCSLDDIKDITQSCQQHTGNLYTTTSRQLAASIMSGYHNTIASTGGPNTMVVTSLTKPVINAIRTSATIESSGQCTALRHCVVPPSTEDAKLKSILDSIQEITDPQHALERSTFDGVFAQHKGSPEPDDSTAYIRHSTKDAFIRISDDLPSTDMREYWRKVVVDFSKVGVDDNNDQLDRLADWLNVNQPISVAWNGPRSQSIKMIVDLFERTNLVVYTVGSSDSDDSNMPPALTCQARPQDGEIFGEFPPRNELNQYTKFPMIVPSSNPSYDALYAKEHLLSRQIDEMWPKSIKGMLHEISNESCRGFCVLLIEYLQNVSRLNPKYGFAETRTVLWGLQRPPLGKTTWIRSDADTSWDEVAPVYLVFYVTNARNQAQLSVHPNNKGLLAICQKYKLQHVVETKEEMLDRLNHANNRAGVFHIVDMSSIQSYHIQHDQYPMVGNFVSLYLPLGHIKSTMPNDQEFLVRARLSEKWLCSLF